MHLAQISAASPPEVPVAALPFRGAELDIYRITVADAFSLMAKAPALVAAWATDGEDRALRIVEQIGRVGPDVSGILLRAGLRVSDQELADAGLSVEEHTEIILAVLDHGIPQVPLGKLLGGLERISVRLAGHLQ